MSNTILMTDWLGHLDREYLSTFIPDGGAAVKFAVATETTRQQLINQLRESCERQAHLFVALNAEKIRVHMPQDIFFALAAQIDWRVLARRVVLNLLSTIGYRIQSVDAGGSDNIIEAVARANEIEPHSVLYELRPIIEREVARNADMAKPFRVAMTHLCILERESPAQREYTGQPLIDWLTGANTRIGNLRPFQIHTPINRTTARYFIESGLNWVRRAGYGGTVVLLDNTRVALARNPKDGKRYYTRAMTMEHYELLREFIDDVERLSGALLVALADPSFVDEQSPRGWAIYPALRTRVMDDVRDRNLANPCAALVRLV